MSTPDEIENARQLVLELKKYAVLARVARLPYTHKLLRAVRADIEMRLSWAGNGK
jgi:hypothetical protein